MPTATYPPQVWKSAMTALREKWESPEGRPPTGRRYVTDSPVRETVIPGLERHKFHVDKDDNVHFEDGVAHYIYQFSFEAENWVFVRAIPTVKRIPDDYVPVSETAVLEYIRSAWNVNCVTPSYTLIAGVRIARVSIGERVALIEAPLWMIRLAFRYWGIGFGELQGSGAKWWLTHESAKLACVLDDRHTVDDRRLDDGNNLKRFNALTEKLRVMFVDAVKRSENIYIEW